MKIIFLKVTKLFIVFIVFSSFTSNEVENSIKINNINSSQINCAARTEQGFSCKRKANNGSNYCSQHNKKYEQDTYNVRYTNSCQAISKSTGQQCKRTAKSGSNYCASHD
jgi:hypothetical protein